MKRLLLILISAGILDHAQSQFPHTYYISPQGNDANSGTSPAHAWQTISKINRTTFHAGDKILFEGGKTFSGIIELDSLDSGSPANPVTVASYGKGKAVIYAGNANGFTGTNCSYITLSNLHFKGRGVEKNTGTGIFFNSTKMDKNCKGIVIDNCVAEGFHNYGILINCAEGEAIKGFDSVTINHCTATANGEAGIASLGGQTAFHHTHIHVTHCIAYLNRGIHTKTDGHSGNGIVMSSVQHLLIDNCLAYENGAFNNSSAGGPVGIWMWVCKDAVIEHCESHHNHAGLDKDGGGFDIDGGCSNCAMQYNYSHDNEGAGYLLAEYGAGLPFANNTVRFNISQNDGRKNGYGGIGFWGVSKAFKVNNTYVYNNTVYINDTGLVNGTPAAVLAMGNNFSHVLLANNVFITGGKARMLNSDTPLDTAAIYFVRNNYYATNGSYAFNYNKAILQGINQWFKADDFQETYHGTPTADTSNPHYISAGGGNTPETVIVSMRGLAAYRLRPGTTVPTGINLEKNFGIDVGLSDFYGSALTHANSNIIGAVAR